jgi:putative endonuclease
VPADARRALGAAGEDAVARWYAAAGYEVVDRNWRCREGELDLVVARGRELVFCEVKTRRGTAFGAPVEAVTATKQQRIRALALQWLGAHPDRRARDLRFDVASVLAARGAAPVIEVLEGVF